MQLANQLHQFLVLAGFWGDAIDLIDGELQAVNLLRQLAALLRTPLIVLGETAPLFEGLGIALPHTRQFRIRTINRTQLFLGREQTQLIILPVDRNKLARELAQGCSRHRTAA